MNSRCTVTCECGSLRLSGVFPSDRGKARDTLTKACVECREGGTNKDVPVTRLDLVKLARGEQR